MSRLELEPRFKRPNENPTLPARTARKISEDQAAKSVWLLGKIKGKDTTEIKFKEPSKNSAED